MEMETGLIIYIQRQRQTKIHSLYFNGLNILHSQLKEGKKIQHFIHEICIGKILNPIQMRRIHAVKNQ